MSKLLWVVPHISKTILCYVWSQFLDGRYNVIRTWNMQLRAFVFILLSNILLNSFLNVFFSVDPMHFVHCLNWIQPVFRNAVHVAYYARRFPFLISLVYDYTQPKAAPLLLGTCILLSFHFRSRWLCCLTICRPFDIFEARYTCKIVHGSRRFFRSAIC